MQFQESLAGPSDSEQNSPVQGARHLPGANRLSVPVSLLLAVGSHGERDLGVGVVMDFRAQQLGPQSMSLPTIRDLRGMLRGHHSPLLVPRGLGLRAAPPRFPGSLFLWHYFGDQGWGEVAAFVITVDVGATADLRPLPFWHPHRSPSLGSQQR